VRSRKFWVFPLGALALIGATVLSLLAFPAPLFAFSVTGATIVVASDRPIPSEGGLSFIRSCEKLLERSPIKATRRKYHVYIASDEFRGWFYFLMSPNAGGIAYHGVGPHVFLSGADFETGELIKFGYRPQPPRTLAYYCAHELTHIVIDEHIGLVNFLSLPEWVSEGLPDYVGIESRETFEQLQAAIGDRPSDNEMMQSYGAYPPYRLLVTYFLEKRGWSIEHLLQTRLTFEEAQKLMRNGGSNLSKQTFAPAS
jgi:hypothetical protein